MIKKIISSAGSGVSGPLVGAGEPACVVSAGGRAVSGAGSTSDITEPLVQGALPNSAVKFPAKEPLGKEEIAKKYPELALLMRPGESLGSMWLRVYGEPLVVTFDGPSAVGKGTVAKEIAVVLGVPFFSSGIVYRVMAYVARAEIPELQLKGWGARRVEEDDKAKTKAKYRSKGKANDKINKADGEGPLGKDLEEKVVSLCRRVIAQGQLQVVNSPEGQRILLTRMGVTEDITKELVSHECSTGASIVAESGPLREALLPFVRSFGEFGCTLDGRDAGTVLFERAQAKFYLSAASEVRAFWRLLQRLHNTDQADLIPPDTLNSEADLEKYLNFINLYYKEIEAIESRDKHDRERKHSPLRKPKDAIVFYPAMYTFDLKDPENAGLASNGPSQSEDEDHYSNLIEKGIDDDEDDRLKMPEAEGRVKSPIPDGIVHYNERQVFEAILDLTLSRLEVLVLERKIGAGPSS